MRFGLKGVGKAELKDCVRRDNDRSVCLLATFPMPQPEEALAVEGLVLPGEA